MSADPGRTPREATRRATLRVVVTGPECTGKTTLARRLATRFAAPCVSEQARLYAAAHSRPLHATDVEPIALGFLAAQAIATREVPPLLVLDTDLVSTVVYARHYYGACAAWIEDEARRRTADLYLLHLPDVPWIPEPGQREGADRRAEQLALFRAELAAIDAPVVEIAGGWELREERAVAAVEALVLRAGLGGQVP